MYRLIWERSKGREQWQWVGTVMHQGGLHLMRTTVHQRRGNNELICWRNLSISISSSYFFKISLAGRYKNLVTGREKNVKKSEQMNENILSKLKTFINVFKQ